MTNKIETQFQCPHLQEDRRGIYFIDPGGVSAEFHGDSKDGKYRNCNSTNFLSTIIFGLEDTIQKSSDFLFWFSVGSIVVGQSSGDGWFIGWIKILPIRFWEEFSKFWAPGLEDCFQKSSDFLFWFSVGSIVVGQSSGDVRFSGWIKILVIDWGWGIPEFWDAWCENGYCFEQDHPEFLLQEEGPSRRTASPERGPVSTRKTDRLHDLRLLSSDWCSWYSIRLRWFILSISLRNDDVQDFDTRWDEILLSMTQIPSDDIL